MFSISHSQQSQFLLASISVQKQQRLHGMQDSFGISWHYTDYISPNLSCLFGGKKVCYLVYILELSSPYSSLNIQKDLYRNASTFAISSIKHFHGFSHGFCVPDLSVSKRPSHVASSVDLTESRRPCGSHPWDLGLRNVGS